MTAEIFKPVTVLMGGCAQPHQSNSPSIVRNEAMDNMTNVGLVKVEVSSIDNNTSLMGLGRHDSRSRQQCVSALDVVLSYCCGTSVILAT